MRLFAGGSNQSEGVGDSDCLLNLRAGPFAGSPVKGLSLFDNVVETPDNLDHGSGSVVAMSENDVDVIQLEPFETRVHALDEMLATQTILVRSLSSSSKEDFGNDYDVVPAKKMT